MGATPPVLEVRGLTKRFGEVTAVSDVSFELRAGEVCGLLGPNGAGKTTTIRIILGLVRPDAGTSLLLGEPTGPGAPVLERVGALVEEAAFYPFLSGRRNLRLYQRARGRSDPDEVERVLKISKLGTAVDRKVKTYSHGMRQRLGIALAMLGAPDVLILDEPTTGLDPAGIREIRELLRTLADEGAAVLLSSHLLAEVELLCDSVIVMSSGDVIASGSVHDVVGKEGSTIEVDDVPNALRILSAAGATAEARGNRLAVSHDGTRRADLVRALVEGGVGVEGAGPRSRLEDAFFAITDTEDEGS